MYCPCRVQPSGLFLRRFPYSPGSGTTWSKDKAVSGPLNVTFSPTVPRLTRKTSSPASSRAPSLKTKLLEEFICGQRQYRFSCKSALQCLTPTAPSSASRGIERNLPDSVNKRGWAVGRETEKETDRCTQADTQTDTQMQRDRERRILGGIIISQRLILLVSLIQ